MNWIPLEWVALNQCRFFRFNCCGSIWIWPRKKMPHLLCLFRSAPGTGRERFSFCQLLVHLPFHFWADWANLVHWGDWGLFPGHGFAQCCHWAWCWVFAVDFWWFKWRGRSGRLWWIRVCFRFWGKRPSSRRRLWSSNLDWRPWWASPMLCCTFLQPP